MFLSRFSWKLYASSAAPVLLTAVGIGALALAQTERTLLEEKESGLRHQCVAMAAESTRFLRGELRDDPVEVAQRLAGSRGTRLTFIAVDGTVLADTHEDPARMDNHLDRPEVQVALVEDFGVATRPSRTVRERMFYVAHVPERRDGEPVGVVRLSLSIADIDGQLGKMRSRFVLVAGLGVLAALGIGAYLAHRLTRPLTEITRAAEGLRSGQYETRLGNLPKDEIGILGDALNRLGVEVTERIRELSAEEAQLRAMLAGMVEGVVAVDAEDRVTFSNLAARDLLGVPDLEGKGLWESVRIADLDSLLSEARSQEEAARRELVYGDPTGREVVLRAQAHRFLAEGRVGVVVVLHDITELRRLERIRRDFVANVSHELKTPLTSIRGYVEALIDGAIDDEQNNRRFLEKVEVNVGRLNHLVADLLSLARIEEQREGLPRERLDLRPLLLQAVRQHENAATRKQILCELEGAEGPLSVMGDRESLVQVVDNLLDNAIKYTPEGGSVRLAARVEDGAVTLVVTDTGIGIPPADLERVFERFYRVDKARSREMGGTGLGLSIVKHLVGAMGGEVGVESELGKGTTFSVRLPRG